MNLDAIDRQELAHFMAMKGKPEPTEAGPDCRCQRLRDVGSRKEGRGIGAQPGASREQPGCVLLSYHWLCPARCPQHLLGFLPEESDYSS